MQRDPAPMKATAQQQAAATAIAFPKQAVAAAPKQAAAAAFAK